MYMVFRCFMLSGAPTISYTEPRQVVLEGSSEMILNCPVLDAKPAAQVTWLKDSREINLSDPRYALLDTSLVIRGVKVRLPFPTGNRVLLRHRKIKLTDMLFVHFRWKMRGFTPAWHTMLLADRKLTLNWMFRVSFYGPNLSVRP